MRQRGVPPGCKGRTPSMTGDTSSVTERDIAWAGVDVGKTHHWVCVIDPTGEVLTSVKVGNDEADLTAVIAKVRSQAEQVHWAADIIDAPSALLLALLTQAEQTVRYASGRVVSAMSAAFPGEG